MNYYQQQQPMGFWGGLLNGLAQGMIVKAEEKRRIAQNQKIIDTENSLYERLGSLPSNESPGATQQGLLGKLSVSQPIPGSEINNPNHDGQVSVLQPIKSLYGSTPPQGNNPLIQGEQSKGLLTAPPSGLQVDSQGSLNNNLYSFPEAAKLTIPFQQVKEPLFNYKDSNGIQNQSSTTAPSKPKMPNRNVLMNNYRKERATALKELVRLGLDPKDAIARVDAIIKQRVDMDYEKGIDDFIAPMEQELESAITTSNNDPNAKRKAIMLAARLNAIGQRFGRPVIDFNAIKYGIESDDVEVTKEDDGAQYRYVTRRKDGRPFGMAKREDGSEYPVYVQAAGDWTPKKMSPAEQDASARGWKSLEVSASKGRGGSSGGSYFTGNKSSGGVTQLDQAKQMYWYYKNNGDEKSAAAVAGKIAQYNIANGESPDAWKAETNPNYQSEAFVNQVYAGITQEIKAGSSRETIEAKLRASPVLAQNGIDPETIIAGIEWPKSNRVQPYDYENDVAGNINLWR